MTPFLSPPPPPTSKTKYEKSLPLPFKILRKPLWRLIKALEKIKFEAKPLKEIVFFLIQKDALII